LPDIVARKQIAEIESKIVVKKGAAPIEGRQGTARRTGQYWTAWPPAIENRA
jgi:hypothetical protein